MPNEYAPVRWSRGGQVCFMDGYGWGIAPSLVSIRLGREEETEKWLVGDEPAPNKLCQSIRRLEDDAIVKEEKQKK